MKKKNPNKLDQIIGGMSIEQRQELFNEMDRFTGKSHELSHKKKLAQERRQKEKRLLKMRRAQRYSIGSRYPIRNRMKTIHRILKEEQLAELSAEFFVVANDVKKWVECGDIGQSDKESIQKIIRGIDRIEKLLQVMEQAQKVVTGLEKRYADIGNPHMESRPAGASDQEKSVYRVALDTLKNGREEIVTLSQETIRHAVHMEDDLVDMRQEEAELKVAVETLIGALPVDKQTATRRLVSGKVAMQPLNNRIVLYRHFQQVLEQKHWGGEAGQKAP